jgi:hypothetical protein
MKPCAQVLPFLLVTAERRRAGAGRDRQRACLQVRRRQRLQVKFGQPLAAMLTLLVLLNV